MELFLEQLMNGIRSGVVYASIALALVLIFRTTGLLNFAQGEMALFSTYITWQLITWDFVPVWVAIVFSVAIAFAMGAVIERVVMRPVENSSPLVLVIVTIGMFLAFNALAQVIFGTNEKNIPRFYPERIWDIGGVSVRLDTLVLVGALVLECVFLWFLLQKTKVGLALRAVANNADSARLVGVSVGTMLMLGWALAAALGALAGALIIPASSPPVLTAGSFQLILVFSFAAAALGGFDSPIGAVVGGLTVGIVNALTVEYVDWLDGIEIVVPFALILLVLLFRPAGLFGKVHVERV